MTERQSQILERLLFNQPGSETGFIRQAEGLNLEKPERGEARILDQTLSENQGQYIVADSRYSECSEHI